MANQRSGIRSLDCVSACAGTDIANIIDCYVTDYLWQSGRNRDVIAVHSEDRMDRAREREGCDGVKCVCSALQTHTRVTGVIHRWVCVCVCVIGVRGRCAPHGVEGDLFSLGDRACCHGAPRAIGGGLVQWGVSFIIENFLSVSNGGK